MESGGVLGEYTALYAVMLGVSLCGLPFLGLKAPRHYLVCVSTVLLVFGLTRGHRHETLRELVYAIEIVASLGVVGGIVVFFLRKSDSADEATDQDSDDQGVIPCPNCGRLNSVRSRICPRCDRHL
jgi:hypothetical protein